jgi:BTB/POZ domain
MESVETIVKLNVGGEIFHTTWSTLLPKAEGATNFFKGLRDFVGSQRDENGAFFIDRDPGLFRVLLQYLRTGCLADRTPTYTREVLLAEADYYGIQIPRAASEEASKDDVVMLHVYGGATTHNYLKAVQVHVFGPLSKETQQTILDYLGDYEQRDKNVFEVPMMKTQPTVSILVMSSCLDLGLVYRLVQLICQGRWIVTSHSNTITPDCPHQKTASSFTRLDFQFTFARRN